MQVTTAFSGAVLDAAREQELSGRPEATGQFVLRYFRQPLGIQALVGGCLCIGISIALIVRFPAHPTPLAYFVVFATALGVVGFIVLPLASAVRMVRAVRAGVMVNTRVAPSEATTSSSAVEWDLVVPHAEGPFRVRYKPDTHTRSQLAAGVVVPAIVDQRARRVLIALSPNTRARTFQVDDPR